MNSVQKSSQIKNFCTEFLHFARSAKITAFYMSKSPVFVFFWQNMAFLIQTELPEWSMATLRYEPRIQFINVSQRALHIYELTAVECVRWTHGIKIERNNLLCEQAPTEAFRSIFAWLVTFNLLNRNSIVINRLSAVL